MSITLSRFSRLLDLKASLSCLLDSPLPGADQGSRVVSIWSVMLLVPDSKSDKGLTGFTIQDGGDLPLEFRRHLKFVPGDLSMMRPLGMLPQDTEDGEISPTVRDRRGFTTGWDG